MMKAAQKCCFFYNMTKANKFKEKIAKGEIKIVENK